MLLTLKQPHLLLYEYSEYIKVLSKWILLLKKFCSKETVVIFFQSLFFRCLDNKIQNITKTQMLIIDNSVLKTTS